MKIKKSKFILLIILLFLFSLALVSFSIVKGYLSQIQRSYDEAVEVISPVDEFFDTDQDRNSAPTINDNSATQPVETPEQLAIDPSEVEWSFIDNIEDDHLINILLVGQDRREGQGRQRSDTMILCSINPETGATSLISFLRDLYVQLPGDYSDNRLNVAYQFGGFELLTETLTSNFGVSIDGSFAVDFAGFETIVDMLGGVTIELTEAEAKYMRETWLVEAKAGINNLNGHQTFCYSKIRAIGNDFGRTARQRTVLLAVFDKVKDLPVNEMLALLYDMLPYLTTDLTDGEILSLAYRLIPMVTSISVETHMVPDHDCYTAAKIRNMSVLVPDREKIRARLEEEYLPLHQVQ